MFFSVEKYYGGDDDESLSLSTFISHGIEQLKSILTTNNSSKEDEKTKYFI